MSSMRNAVTRWPHKERSQPSSRSKWGILEKHKDYSLRAQDYNLKKRKLSQLAQKARDRNPDEFAFGMLSAATAKQGKHGRAGNENLLSHNAVKLLKSQDAGYLRTAAGMGRREIERAAQAMRLGDAMRDGEGIGKKIVFVESEISREERRNSDGKAFEDTFSVDTVENADVHIDMADNPPLNMEDEIKQKSKKALVTESKAKLDLRAGRKRRKRLGELRAAKLEVLKKRQREIMAAADQLELQRAKMARSVGGINKNGVKFKIRERKK